MNPRRIAVSVLALAAASAAWERPLIRLGAGLGNGFGLVGFGGEAEFRRVALSGGVGLYALDEKHVEGSGEYLSSRMQPAWDLGLKYHFAAPGREFRPYAAFYYAPAAILHYSSELFGVVDQEVLIYGYASLLGLSYDLGEDIGINLIGAVGAAFSSGHYPRRVREDYRLAGLEPPESSVSAAFSFGIQYEF